MKSMIKSLLTIALIAVMAAGCGPSLAPGMYTTGGAGQVNRVIAGKVVSVQPVQISANSSGVAGTVVGGLAGGILGSTIGHGTGSALAALGGAVAGGVLGNAAENHLTQQQGLEYVVKTKDGSMVSVVQGPTPVFYRGQHVLVEYGDQARIIPDPNY